MGDRAYIIFEDYYDELEGSVVEIGSSNGEGSTFYFAGLFFRKPKFKFYTIDFNSEVHHNVEFLSSVDAYNMKGEDFLRNKFPEDEKICFAYLDNFDWIWKGTEYTDHTQYQKNVYSGYNLTMNNHNSQLAHLRQAIEIFKLAADKCVILLDDTMTDNGEWFSGKGGMAVPWLIANGWNLIIDHWINYDCSVVLKNW